VIRPPSPEILPPQQKLQRTQSKPTRTRLQPLEYFDRYFEVLVAFSQGSESLRKPQIEQLRLVAAAMKKRPRLTLQLNVYAMNAEQNSYSAQQLYSIQLFFAAEQIPFEVLEAEESDPRDDAEGIVCTLRLDNDADLIEFYTKGRENVSAEVREAIRSLTHDFRMR
jgi:hypothetical protein